MFVHGCFRHGRDRARSYRAPKSNDEFWRAKIERNRARDAGVAAALEAAGWRVLALRECGLRDREGTAERLRGFLGPVRVG